MGEAKRRGLLEQRKEAAIDKMAQQKQESSPVIMGYKRSTITPYLGIAGLLASSGYFNLPVMHKRK